MISFNDEQRNILLENDTNFYFSNMSVFFLTKFYQYVLWIENVKKKMLYKYELFEFSLNNYNKKYKEMISDYILLYW